MTTRLPAINLVPQVQATASAYQTWLKAYIDPNTPAFTLDTLRGIVHRAEDELRADLVQYKAACSLPEFLAAITAAQDALKSQ